MKRSRIWINLFIVLLFTFSSYPCYSQTSVVLTPIGQEQVKPLSDQEKIEVEVKRRQLLGRILAINDPETMKKLSDFFLVHDVTKSHFVDIKTSPSLIDLAMIGMVGGLDPYSNLFIGEDAELAGKSLSGEENLIGIGMQIGNDYKSTVIIEVYDGSPAAKAGLQPGDVLLKVNGENVFGMSTAKVASLVRGPEGTPVVIEIKAVRFQKPKSITIVRETVVIQSVDYKELNNGFVYIKIKSFRSETVGRFLEALQKSCNKKVVMDLRNNGGGSLEAVNHIVGFLIGPGKVLISKKGRSDNSELLTPPESDILTCHPSKIVLLINNNSASASEIMAGDLQHYKIATLVGVRTLGKATVQNYLPLDGKSIRESRLILGVTIARYYLPDGTSITDIGVRPDIEVDQPRYFKNFEYLTKKDAQFQRALKILKQIP